MNNNATALDPVNVENNDNANPFAPRKRQRVQSDPHLIIKVAIYL
jgi:hypothetical protein